MQSLIAFLQGLVEITAYAGQATIWPGEPMRHQVGIHLDADSCSGWWVRGRTIAGPAIIVTTARGFHTIDPTTFAAEVQWWHPTNCGCNECSYYRDLTIDAYERAGML